MLSQLRPALTLIAIFTLLTGVLMPLGFVGFGKLVMPYQAGGSLVVQNGKVVGSAIIGQNFTADKYFHGRPSALMGTDPKDSTKQVATPYDASESGASNLGPTSKALVDRVAGDVKAYHGASVPADAITTSGSGLDPDISPAYAAVQIERVAKARNMSSDSVQRLVDAHTAAPVFGFFGGARVNVLSINLALDARSGSAVARH